MYPRTRRRRRRVPLAACVAILSAVPPGAAAQSRLQLRSTGPGDTLACAGEAHDPDHRDCRRRPRLAFVESGILLGKSSGLPAAAFSPLVGFMEVGLLCGARGGRSRSGWGIGATAFLAGGAEDFRFALKPRLRYRFTPSFATDFSAGPMWTLPVYSGASIDKGYLASVSLQLGSWLTLRTDLQSRHVDLWSYRSYDGQVEEAAGNETGVYMGFAMRNRPGWTATIVGTGVVCSLFVLVAIAIAGMGGMS